MVAVSTALCALIEHFNYITMFGNLFPGGTSGNPHANAGDLRDKSSIHESGRSPEEGNGDALQYSYLKNLMNRGAWQATVYRVAKSRTLMRQFSI